MIQLTDATVTKLKKLRSLISKKGSQGELSLYDSAGKLGFTASEVNALRKMNIIQMTDKPVNGRKYGYSWNENKEPNMGLLMDIEKMETEISRKGSRKHAERKRRKGQQVQPKVQIQETESVESTEKPDQSAAAVPEKTTKDEPSIPISVEVTTDGGKKTVTIKIEI